MALFKNDKHADLALVVALSATAFAAGMSFRSNRPRSEESYIAPIVLPDNEDDVLPAEEDVSRADRATSSRFWWGLVMFTLIGLLVVCSIGFLTWYGNPGAADRAPKSVDAWRNAMSGWVDPTTSLVVASGVLALIATINISVSLASTQGSVSVQVATSYWSTVLTLFSFVSAVFVFVVSCMAWVSVVGEPKSAKGTAILSTIMAIGCLVLAASIAFNNENSATRRRSLTQIDMKNEQLDERLKEIFPWRVLANRKWFPRAASVIVRLVVIATLMALLGYGGILSVYPGEIRWVKLLTSLWVGALYGVVVVWLVTYLRWSMYHRAKDWSPCRVSLGCAIAWAAATVWIAWDSEGLTASVIIVGVVALLPTAVVVISWPQRALWEPFRWVRWFGWPLWYEIGKSLESQIAAFTARREELASPQITDTDPLAPRS